MKPSNRRHRAAERCVLAALLLAATAASAGDYRLVERRVDKRQKTEVEVDLPPGCVVTGLGARAHVDNLTTMHVEYRRLRSDGTLGPPAELRLGSEPEHDCEAKITLPDGWVATGFGARGAPEWDVATLRVWGRPLKGGKVRAWSAGREPEGGLERSVKVEEPGRVLVGVGLRFHQNDIQGIYARSARVVEVPGGDRSMRLLPGAGGAATLRLLAPDLGPLPLAALDADRIQTALLKLWRQGNRTAALDLSGLRGAAAEPTLEICRALGKDPFQAADGVVGDIVQRRVGRENRETAVRALSRIPLIARLAFAAAGQPFLGKDGRLPGPADVSSIKPDDASLRAVAGEKATARWLLVQSRGEIAALRERRDGPWLEQLAGELEELALAVDVWERFERAEILSRRYLIDGAPATKREALEALENAKRSGRGPAFGDPAPLEAAVVSRLAVAPDATELGGILARIDAQERTGDAEGAARRLAALLRDKRFAGALKRHLESVARLATRCGALDLDAASTRVLWGGDGRWKLEKRSGRWACVTTPEGPCVYLDAVGSNERVTVEFSFFDGRPGRIDLHYNSLNPETGGRDDYRAAPPVAMQGTRTWRRAAVPLAACRFGSNQNLGADLRLIPNLRDVAIRAIRIRAR